MHSDPAEGRAEEGERGARARSVRVLLAAILVTTGGVLPPFLLGALAVQVKADLGGGPTVLGLVIALFFVTAGFGAIPLGRIVDRMGWQRAMPVAGTGSALAMVGISVAATSWWVLAAFLFLAGLSHALASPASHLAIARELPRGRRGLSFGVKQAATPAALLVGGSSVPVLGLTVGWRWAFMVAAVLPLVAIMMVPRGSRPVRTPAVFVPRDERTHARAMLALAVAGATAAMVVTAVGAFLTSGTVDAGLTEASAGALLAVVSALSLVTRVGAGIVSDWRRSGGLRPVAAMLVAGAVGFALLSSTATALILVGAALAFAAGGGWPGLFHFAVIHHNDDRPARATGNVQAGLSTGAAAGPLVFGFVADHASYAAGWWTMAGLSLLAAALILGASRHFYRVDAAAVRPLIG
jgi:MFS family permease